MCACVCVFVFVCVCVCSRSVCVCVCVFSPVFFIIQKFAIHKDCLDGGKPKAETAAKRIAEIFPGMVCLCLCLCLFYRYLSVPFVSVISLASKF